MKSNIKKTYLIIGLTALFSCEAFSQTKLIDNPHTKMLFEKLGQVLFPPMPEDTQCTVYSTITFHIRNGKMLDSIDYSRDLPQGFRDEFSRVIPFYKETDWNRAVPDTGHNCEVYQPFVYYYYYIKPCPDSIPDRQMKKMLKEDIGKNAVKMPTFQLLPIRLRAYQVVR
ncbi:hypothetical protein [Chitinophaga sp. RAB17]|uniref:hypothetical protein n=1 Tax=Chitinophaga sp. RAB17 TaxID=3233049 RepID=UPI003F90DE9F